MIKKEWLVALLQQMKRIASTTGSDSSGETEWTHPDFALVCHDPHSKATKPELLAHLTAWCDPLNIKETSDWGSIGTNKEPLELVAIFKVITLRLQERPIECTGPKENWIVCKCQTRSDRSRLAG